MSKKQEGPRSGKSKTEPGSDCPPLGLALGAGMGLALGNLVVGVAIGVAVGLAIEAAYRNENN